MLSYMTVCTTLCTDLLCIIQVQLLCKKSHRCTQSHQ
ncbi:hypothetical protein TSAR_005490 [Trichomalopsis sarcophagae]|uniref:Uncharacterized protein n=1 Tax=Trichomalopsis sarcophagae TaxID=543379 RepID=A0A232ERK1_9HYME|nr:hypothetical protein TSAR_005490 [Trichomalopsis sarcophagae]